jgi:hypothetical protein
VEYDGQGAGYEAVLVNGQVAARVTNLSLLPYRLVPHIDFTLPTPAGGIPASIDVHVGGYRLLAGFRLNVDGEAVYAEGIFRTGVSPDLPIPASAPDPAIAALPIPAESAGTQSLQTDQLPIPAREREGEDEATG